jgi:hypothetical protein
LWLLLPYPFALILFEESRILSRRTDSRIRRSPDQNAIGESGAVNPPFVRYILEFCMAGARPLLDLGTEAMGFHKTMNPELSDLTGKPIMEFTISNTLDAKGFPTEYHGTKYSIRFGIPLAEYSTLKSQKDNSDLEKILRNLLHILTIQ